MISYRVGDATHDPTVIGNKIIAHGCNDVGAWGAGFVLAVSRRWKEPERRFRAQALSLGDLQLVQVSEDTWVANLVIQQGIRNYYNKAPCIRYPALKEALTRLGVEAKAFDATVMMPRIGCGLAGGSWDQVGPLVESCLEGLNVICYDQPGASL